MTTVRELIADADDGGAVVEVTGQVVKQIVTDHHDLAAKIIFPVVRDEVRRLRRQATRRAEDRAFATFDSDPLAALRELASESFWCPLADDTVRWIDATAEQHESRADWTCKHQIKPLQLDVERHELAAELIREAGVRCLADLDWMHKTPGRGHSSSGPQSTTAPAG